MNVRTYYIYMQAHKNQNLYGRQRVHTTYICSTTHMARYTHTYTVDGDGSCVRSRLPGRPVHHMAGRGHGRGVSILIRVAVSLCIYTYTCPGNARAYVRVRLGRGTTYTSCLLTAPLHELRRTGTARTNTTHNTHHTRQAACVQG